MVLGEKEEGAWGEVMEGWTRGRVWIVCVGGMRGIEWEEERVVDGEGKRGKGGMERRVDVSVLDIGLRLSLGLDGAFEGGLGVDMLDERDDGIKSRLEL